LTRAFVPPPDWPGAPLPPVGYSTLPPAPELATTCACGAELQTEAERLDERCTGCSTAARARWLTRREESERSEQSSGRGGDGA